ncbi:MAG: helix-hairpin-helix domain-containing protein [Acidimicrobiales bacterium]
MVPDIRDRLADWAREAASRVSPLVWVVIAAVVVAVGGVVWLATASDAPPARLDTADVPRATVLPDPTPGGEADVVVVHVAGAVVAPGVYHVQAGARVADVVAAAGGPTVDGETDRLNLAAPVADGERVYVPRVGEEIVAPVGGSGAAAGGGPVDLNTADSLALQGLPGVGPTIAAAIIARREEARFASVEDLLDVAGIGPTRLDALRDLVTVR